jgi:hypothetical protein
LVLRLREPAGDHTTIPALAEAARIGEDAMHHFDSELGQLT